MWRSNSLELVTIIWFCKWLYRSQKPQHRVFPLPSPPLGEPFIQLTVLLRIPSVERPGKPLLTSPLNPFPFKKPFLPFASGKAEWISLNSPVLFADWKGLPRPGGRVAAWATARQGRAGSCGVKPPVLTGWPPGPGREQLTKQPARLLELGSKRVETVNQHHRSTVTEYNIWWSPVSFKTLRGTKVGFLRLKCLVTQGYVLGATWQANLMAFNFYTFILWNPSSYFNSIKNT